MPRTLQDYDDVRDIAIRCTDAIKEMYPMMTEDQEWDVQDSITRTVSAMFEITQMPWEVIAMTDEWTDWAEFAD